MAATYTNFRVVPDELRKLATQQKWSEVITQISIGRTIMIPTSDSKSAANALSQAMRSRGLRLRRKTVEVEGEKGTLFWADKPLGN